MLNLYVYCFSIIAPSAPNVSISSRYFSNSNCRGVITLTWPAVSSDRPVRSYSVLLNGTRISILNPAIMNVYIIRTNLLQHYGIYTVTSTSCVGSNTSSPVVFTPLTAGELKCIHRYSFYFSASATGFK